MIPFASSGAGHDPGGPGGPAGGAGGAGGGSDSGRERSGGGPDATSEPQCPAGEEPLELPIDGTLDLHTFAPAEARELVRDYVEACRERGILEVRIIHGKGKGVLARIVRSVLEKTPGIVEIRPGGEGGGGWGATLVTLAPADPGRKRS